jgi:hypothetical protein
MKSPSTAATRNVWCTELDLGDERPETLVAPRIPEFDSVRVLLRLHGEPLQFAERGLVNGQVATNDLLRGLNDSARARLIDHLELDGADPVADGTVGSRSTFPRSADDRSRPSGP